MIKVLVVEDDKLVRMGLVSALPWKKYGMEVVGEANNGAEALEFIKQHEVHCVLTDLAMPIMSGIELMQNVRTNYPSLHIVVLTLHKDFDLIQEALRLGAIDYIAKVELEKDTIEAILSRIQRLIIEKQALEAAAPADSERFNTDLGYILLSLEDNSDLLSFDHSSLFGSRSFQEIESSIWLWLPENESNHVEKIAGLTQRLLHKKYWSIIKAEGMQGKNKHEFFRYLRKYRQRSFFYEYDKNTKIICKSFQELIHSTPKVSEDEFQALKEQWVSFDWIYQESLFHEMLQALKTQRLPVTKLVALILEITTAWNKNYGPISSSMTVPETLMNWQETVKWLSDVRESTNRLSVKHRYSEEIVNCIMSAVKIVQEEMNQPIFAVNVAKRVNMSRNYFNKCFADIMGSSYNDYLRNLRLEKAKCYLLNTNKPIQWIAEQTGYSDEKYFSRIFRQHYLMTPTDYRNKGPCK